MNEDKNITQNDMRFFQNEVLNDLKKLEIQFDSRITGINQLLLTKTSEYDSKISRLFENVTELIAQMAQRKFDNERVEDLLKMKNKFSDQIIENSSKISIMNKTMENALFKYDKIILDNLNVPGLIGRGSKFKNCAAYFKYIDKEMEINQKFKEEGITNLKAFSEKVESKLKKSEGDISQIMQNANHIFDVKFEKIMNKLEERRVVQENMMANMRIENSKYASDLIQASTDLKIQWDKLENIKNEIYAKYDAEVDKFKKLVLVTDRGFKKQEEEFTIFKQRFSQLAEYLKDFKNYSKNYREITKNIDFSKKQKLKDEFDSAKYNEIAQDVKNYIKSPKPIRKKRFSINEDEDKKEGDNSMVKKNNTRNMNKRSSLSPSPRKTATYIKKKRMSELEKINKIAKEGDKRLSNVLTFKNKLKEINDQNDNGDKKNNMNYFYKSEFKRKRELTNYNNKKVDKTLKRKKTIVTENNIDLNFDTNKENENYKEPSENSSISSNFSLSSIISLKKIGDDSKEEEEKKEIKNKSNIKENNKDSSESKSSVIEENSDKSSKISKTETEKKSEEINANDKNKYFKYESEKISQNNNMSIEIAKKKNTRNEINSKSIKKENSSIINKKKENNIYINNSPTTIKLNKFKNKTTNLDYQKESSLKINKNLENKNLSPDYKKKIFAFKKEDLKEKNKLNNKYGLILNVDNKNNISIDKANKVKTVPLFNKQIKQEMTEYTNKNNTQTIRKLNIKPSNEVTFPQIKLKSNEINNNINSPPQIIKFMTNTPKENIKIKDKLILGTNSKPFTYKALLTKQTTNPINNNNNDNNKKTISESLDKKEEKIKSRGNQDIRELNINNNNVEKEKEDNNINVINTNTNMNTNVNTNIETNNETEKPEKDHMTIKNLFNSLYDEIKEIKDITKNNKLNKEEDNILNNNGFITSLSNVNNVNNNYNLYYNNSDLYGSNTITITIPKTKKTFDNETLKKFDNEINFINGNIKLVNHRITSLENKYQLILDQLNNIFNTVSIYYHHRKRKKEQNNTFRINNKRGPNQGRSIDYQNEEELFGDNKKFMMKLKGLYNDNYENSEEYKLKIPNDEYSKTLRKIEPFLIKKFKDK